MRKLLAVLILLILACSVCFAETMSKAWELGIIYLEHYLNAPSGSAEVKLDEIAEMFTEAGQTNQAKGFLIYVNLLQNIEDEDWTKAERNAAFLKRNNNFIAFISDDTFKSQHFAIGSVDELVVYYEARKKYAEGDVSGALEDYLDNGSYYDSYERGMKIFDDYDAALKELTEYVLAGRAKDSAELNMLTERFHELGNFEYSSGFYSYAQVLESALSGNERAFEIHAESIKADTEFAEYLSSAEFTRKYNGFGSADDVINYARGRLSERKNDVVTAYNAYEACFNYMDAFERAFVLADLLPTPTPIPAKVGDIVVFGSYEQDNNISNGKEPIEWIVLDRDGDKALLISKFALDTKPYSTNVESVTWETCMLRTWLNNDFYNTAFNASEQSFIENTVVTADENPDYSTPPGNNTTDKVFLLSIQEAKRYFPNDDARICGATDHAVKNGALPTSNYYLKDPYGGWASCWWWLRSPGYFSFNAACVYDGGSVSYYGGNVSYCSGSVRPCVWVRLF